MADRLVDLQDHLVGRQQQVHGAGLDNLAPEAVGWIPRQFAAQPDGKPSQSRISMSSLAAIAAAAEGTGLCVSTVVGGGAERRHQGTERLLHAAAIGGEVQGRQRLCAKARRPSRQCAGRSSGERFRALQQVDLVGQRDALPGFARQELAYSPLGRFHDDLREVHHAVGGVFAGPLARLVNRLADAARSSGRWWQRSPCRLCPTR